MNILVIGESCIDEYILGTCDRVCPEAAALCFKDTGLVKTNLGMAGNVLTNIKSIRPNYKVDIITNTDVSIIKKRFVDTRYNSIVFRHDINDSCDRIDVTKYSYHSYDAVVISDYCKGFLTEKDISYILHNIDQNCVSFIDTKKKISHFINGASFLKINNKEFKENILDLKSIRTLSKIIVTQGDSGALYIDKNTETLYSTKKIHIRDVCGAGDTFMAALAVRYIETHDIATSIHYANECAGSVVSKFGVCVP